MQRSVIEDRLLSDVLVATPLPDMVLDAWSWTLWWPGCRCFQVSVGCRASGASTSSRGAGPRTRGAERVPTWGTRTPRTWCRRYRLRGSGSISAIHISPMGAMGTPP